MWGQSLHRARQLLLGFGTTTINHVREILAEYGVILKVSAGKVEEELNRLVNDPDDTRISPFLKETFRAIPKELSGFYEKLEDFDRQIAQFVKTNPVCQRLLTVPGVGVLTATVLLALVGDPFRFKNGRQFAAFEDVHLLVIYSPDASFVRKLMNFREIRRKIVNALGPFVQKFYFAPS
jgi:transposase